MQKLAFPNEDANVRNSGFVGVFEKDEIPGHQFILADGGAFMKLIHCNTRYHHAVFTINRLG